MLCISTKILSGPGDNAKAAVAAQKGNNSSKFNFDLLKRINYELPPIFYL